MQKLKQVLINKYAIYGTFAVWALLKSFAPIAHIDSSQPYFNIMPVYLANLVIYIPVAAIFYLVLYKHSTVKDKNIKIWKLFNINAFLLICYLILIAFTILQIYSITIFPIAARGTLLSWGMLISLTMAITYKLRSKPDTIAILVALLASFCVIGLFEAPYQICRYYFADYNLIMNTQNLKAVLVRQIFFSVPFILAFISWKIKFTRTSLICLGTFIVLWIIWLVPGHFQVLYAVDFETSTTRLIMSDPINWLWYSTAKICKVLLVLLMLFLNYNNLAKGEKNYEAIPNNQPV